MSALYIQKEGRQWGPFTTEELEGQMAAGAFSRDDLYWTEGMEEWSPLAAITEIETEPAVVAGAIPEEEVDEDFDGVYFNEDGIYVSIDEISWPNHETVEPSLVAKSSATVEHVKRVRPLSGAVILGVLAVVVGLLEIPKTTTTHWVIWSAILLVLLFFGLRMLQTGLRRARSMVVIDMVDGTEYIIPAGPEIAQKVSDAVKKAAAHSKRRVGGY